ncbi:hypothetical protein COPR103792_00360 [Corynebacterium propinquum]
MRGEERDQLVVADLMGGITSACAEKSTVDNGTRGYAWNYLRMRGEEGARATQRIA